MTAEAPIPVVISDPSHPHYGCRGKLTGAVIRLKHNNEKMAYVKLDGCSHGTDACYASVGQVTKDPTPP